MSGYGRTVAHGKRRDMLVHENEPFNAETPRAALAEGPVTALDAFYVRSHAAVPDLPAESWRLSVQGCVARELELSLNDLRARYCERRLLATLQCAGNRRSGLQAVRPIPGEAPWGPGATGTAEWVGVALAEVLADAGLRDDATHIEFIGADLSKIATPPQRFGGSIPRRKAVAEEVLLAWAMNGEFLPAVHGAPLRVIVPGYIGARSVKWLTQVVARRGPSENFFQAHSYRLLPPDAPTEAAGEIGIALGAIAVNCDFLSPQDGVTLSPGQTWFEGYAFAGDDRHIVRVDVSHDGGHTWSQASLIDAATPWAWRRWRVGLSLPSGEQEIVARAWDSAAATQPADPADVWNPKGYVNNSWARLRVRVAD